MNLISKEMLKGKLFFFFSLIMVLLASCGGSKTSSLIQGGDTLALSDARNLLLVRYKGYTLAQLRNPWDTLKVLHTYILVPRADSLPVNLPEGTVVRTPLSHTVIYSSVHCSLLQELGAMKRIGGICDLKYMRLPAIRERCSSGQIADIGDAMNPNIEKLIDLHPDAILLSPFENSGGYGRVEKLNIPLIECADYMENSALGRAEWMKFYGILFGCEAQADSLFTKVRTSYLALSAKVKKEKQKPLLLVDLPLSSTWYQPGGHSTMGHLYADAGARTLMQETSQSGSIPLAFETVFDKGQDADIWLIRYNEPVDKTLQSLAKERSAFTQFRAFQQKKVYACNTSTSSFYEETPFHPDWLLEDLIKIMHPNVLSSLKLRYYNIVREK